MIGAKVFLVLCAVAATFLVASIYLHNAMGTAQLQPLGPMDGDVLVEEAVEAGNSPKMTN